MPNDKVERNEPQSPETAIRNHGPTWLLLLLAFLPFVLKIATIWFGPNSYLFQSSYKFAQLAGPIYWRRKYLQLRGWKSCWPLDDAWPTARMWLWGALAAIALAVSAILAVLILAPWLEIDASKLRLLFDRRFDVTPIRAALIVVYLFTINAALEEFHFRVWLDKQLSIRFGDWAGIAGSSLAFGAMHTLIFAGMEGVSGLAVALVCVALTIAGISWSILMRQTSGIYVPWLSHGLTDSILLTWGLFWLGYF